MNNLWNSCVIIRTVSGAAHEIHMAGFYGVLKHVIFSTARHMDFYQNQPFFFGFVAPKISKDHACGFIRSILMAFLAMSGH